MVHLQILTPNVSFTYIHTYTHTTFIMRYYRLYFYICVYIYIYRKTCTPIWIPENSCTKRFFHFRKTSVFCQCFPIHIKMSDWIFLDGERLTPIHTHFWAAGHLLFNYNPKESVLENRLWESHMSAQSHESSIQDRCSSVNSHYCVYHEVVSRGLHWGEKPEIRAEYHTWILAS